MEAAHYSILLYGRIALRRDLLAALRGAAYQVITATGEQEVQSAIKGSEPIAVALMDSREPDLPAYGAMAFLKEQCRETQIIFLSQERNVYEAVEAEKRGVFWLAIEPIASEELLFLIARACVVFELARSNLALLQSLSSSETAPLLQSSSPRTADLYSMVERAAHRDSTILLTGESGTGKTTVARLIHQQSARHSGPFITVNCASIPRELFEAELFGYERGAFTGAVTTKPGRLALADGGTLFFDEVAEIPLDVQPKLLTFLHDREVQALGSTRVRKVDLRIIAATNRDLKLMVQAREFREDLYFRINVINLTMPALRERREDIAGFAQAYLDRLVKRHAAAPCSLREDARAALQQHSWPGNIRELENVIERAWVFSDGTTITPSDLHLVERPTDAIAHPSDNAPGKWSEGKTLAQIEYEAVLAALAAHGNNKERAAQALGVSVKTIYNKLRRDAPSARRR